MSAATTPRAPAAGRSRSRPRGGAPLPPPAIAYVVVSLVGIALPPALAGVAPYSSDADLLAFYGDHAAAAHLSAFLLLASAVPLAVFTAIVSHRIGAAGLDVPGRVIAAVGGTAAAVMLALSGLATMTLTQPHVADSLPVARALQGLIFSTGGTGFVVFQGLLLAGVSVPALVGRLAPRWVAWLGLALAVVCEVATLTAATSALTPLLPIGRFGAMVWLLAVAFTLSARPRREKR